MQVTIDNNAEDIYLSVVATTRNDNHGGSLTRRTQHFVDGFVAQCKRHDLRAELILVEWNPPTDRVPLFEDLRWPIDTGPCAIRIITIPPDLHQTFEHSDKLPLFQFIAKNAGIRRARGKFVLATNIDILFSDEAMIFMKNRLVSGRLYRTNRLDVPTEVPDSDNFQNILDFCWKNYFRINANGYTAVKEDHQWTTKELFYARMNPRLRGWLIYGKTQVTSRFLRFDFRGKLSAFSFLRSDVEKKIGNLTGIQLIIAWIDFIETVIRRLIHIPFLIIHGALWIIGNLKVVIDFIEAVIRRLIHIPFLIIYGALWIIGNLKVVGARAFRPMLFTNACGDFTLMAKQDWERLKGYPEWPIFSWHLDSVFLYQSAYSGFRETYLGDHAPVFHIEHGKGSGYTPEGAELLFSRLEKAGLPFLTDETFTRLIEEQKAAGQNGTVIKHNADDWGLLSNELSETRIS